MVAVRQVETRHNHHNRQSSGRGDCSSGWIRLVVDRWRAWAIQRGQRSNSLCGQLGRSAIKRFLDTGCDGIILPQMSSSAEVDEIARAALYPPRGERSVGIARAQGYGTRFAECLRRQDYAIIVQIETAAGVRNAETIVGHEAVDAVVIGPYDLSGSLGIPGQIEAPQVVEGIAAVQAFCSKAGKPCGIFAADSEKAKAYALAGFDLIAAGMDCSVLLNGYKALRDSIA